MWRVDRLINKPVSQFEADITPIANNPDEKTIPGGFQFRRQHFAAIFSVAQQRRKHIASILQLKLHRLFLRIVCSLVFQIYECGLIDLIKYFN